MIMVLLFHAFICSPLIYGVTSSGEKGTNHKLKFGISFSYKFINSEDKLKDLLKTFHYFRTKYSGLQIRLLAFWDKSDNKETLVIATHGFIKKVDKVPSNELERAVRLKETYFNNKLKR